MKKTVLLLSLFVVFASYTYASPKSDYKKAVKYYTKAIKLNPNNADYYAKRASMYDALGQYDLAFKDIEKAIELNPEEVKYRENRIVYYFDIDGKERQIKKDFDTYITALEDFKIMREHNPDFFVPGKSPEKVIEYSLCYSNKKRGIEYFSSKLKGKENDIFALRDLARCYTEYDDKESEEERAKTYNLAIETYTKIIDEAAKTGSRFFFETQKCESEAEGDDCFEIIGRLNLNDIYLERARIYKKLGQYESALKDYNSIDEMFPSPRPYAERAKLYAELKDYKSAIKDYTKAIELEPEYSSNYLNRAKLYAELKDYESALKDYTKLIELDPQSPDGYKNRADFYVNYLKDYEAAMKDYKQIKKEDLMCEYRKNSQKGSYSLEEDALYYSKCFVLFDVE